LLLDPAAVATDVAAFDAAITRGDPASLTRAVALYRGPLLEGCPQMWVFQERLPREQACVSALETLAARSLEQGQPAAAAHYLRHAIAFDPLRESAHRRLMQALADEGNFAAVVQVYRDLRALLHREVNTEPDPETRSLFRQLQAGVTCGSEPPR